jgi:hypothetical protein
MTKSAPIYIAGTVLVGIFTHASPSRGGDESVGPGKTPGCETIARRSYDLCMAGPNAGRERCLREYDDTYLRCQDPTEPTTPPPGPSNLSRGVYRFPYADGTKVHVSRDFHDHNPPGKLDMSGRGGGTYRVVAAAAGTIRFIQDSRSKQQHPERWLRNTDDCNNNYVWIEHDNGEWSKYSHMQQYSTTRKAGRKVGDRISEGAYLGDEGKVGCAWPAHLHFEIAVPSSDAPTIADLASGALKGYGPSQARNPVIRGVSGKTLKDGQTYVINPPPKCKNDDDCGAGTYCNAGVDLTKNTCLPLKDDNETCALVGGGHQCKSGSCRFSRCYTPGSVAMGDTCYNDDACRDGKCSDIDGVKGVCVCKSDGDCGDGKYCDAGFDLKINACRSKLSKGQTCGKAGSFGNDHKCKSGKCSGFPKYECK